MAFIFDKGKSMITAHRVDAFTFQGKGGNPAGVVLNADGIPEYRMQQIAAELNYSETAFILESSQADHQVRYFAPRQEMDLCGHATIASYHLLHKNSGLSAGRYKLETRAGLLDIDVGPDGLISMAQNLPEFFETLDSAQIASALSLKPEQFDSGLSAQIVSTGVKKIFAPVQSLAALDAIEPRPEEIVRISKAKEATGIFAFTLDTPTAVARCRNFSPLVGIFEESATGTSCGALSCYLHHWGKLEAEQLGHLVFEQGYIMGQPSELIVSLEVDDGKVTRVSIAGRATMRESKQFQVFSKS